MRAILFGLLSLLIAGCGSGGGVEEGTTRAPDGLAIAYDVRGRGETALVFLHCWACDRTFWRNQLDTFAEEYRVVSVDLGGHGESGTDREEWHIKDLAEDARAVAEKLDLPRVLWIGHSMGGPVALEAARLLPDRTIGVIAVESLHDAEFEPPTDLTERVIAQFEADFEGTMNSSVRSMFSEGVDPAVVDWVVGKAVAADSSVALALIRDSFEMDIQGALAAVGVPVRAINAGPGAMSARPTAVETNQKYADFDARFMPGVGHYPMLERPLQFNNLLREVIREIESGT